MIGTMESKLKFGIGVKLAHGAGNLTSQMVYQMFTFLIFSFYWAVIKIDINLITVGFIIWSVWNAFNEPLAGYLSDRTKSRWGRRIPYIAASLIPLSLIMFFLWTPVSLLENDFRNFTYFLIIIIAFDGIYTLAFLNHTSLFPEMFQDEKERASANSIRQVLTVVGLIFGFVIPTLFITDPLSKVSSAPSYRAQIISEYQLAGLIIAIIAFITLFISLKWGCKERKEFKEDPYKNPKFWNALKYTLKNRSFLTYVVAGLMCWTVFSILPTLMTLYGAHILGIPENETIWIGLLLGAAFIVSAGLVFFWKYLGLKIGVKKAFIISLIVFAVALQPLLLISDRWMGLAVFAGVGVGLAGPIYFIDLIISHIVDEDELKTGVRREGMYYGINGFLIRFATVISFIAIAIAFNSTGWHIYDPGLGITTAQLLALRLLYTLFPAICLIIAIIALQFYPLSGSRLEKVLAAKEKLHAEKAEKIGSY